MAAEESISLAGSLDLHVLRSGRDTRLHSLHGVPIVFPAAKRKEGTVIVSCLF